MDIDDSRILITGGAGFVGAHLTRRLQSNGAEIRVIDDLSAGSAEILPEQTTIDTVDIRSEECQDRIREYDPDAIIHLAAKHFIPFCNAHPEETFEVNVMGTRNVLEVSESLDLDAFVFTSSGAVYPPDRDVHSETDDVAPDDIYGRTKLVGEDLAERFYHRTGTPTVTIRLFNVYGLNETNEHLIPAILKQLDEGTRKLDLGNLSPKRDFIHVSDVTRAYQTLIKELPAEYQTYNVGGGDAYSVEEVVQLLSEAMNEELSITQDDDRVRESDRPHLEADITRIKSETSWEPRTDFVTGLRDLLEYREIIPPQSTPE